MHRGLRHYNQRDLRTEPVLQQSIRRGGGWYGYFGQRQHRGNEAGDLDKQGSERNNIAFPINNQWRRR